MRTPLAPAALLSIALAAAACSGGAPDAGPTLAGEARVTWRSDAVVLSPEDAARAVIDEANDESTFLLDPSVPGVSAITPGKSFLLGGIALRHADAVETKDGKVLVTTSAAAITDVVEEGHLGWDGAVDFTAGTPKKTSGGGVSPLSTPAVSVTGSIGRWAFEVGQQTDDNGVMQVTLSASRNSSVDTGAGGSGANANGSLATVTATLRVRRPKLHGSIDISNHVSQNAELAMKSVDADVTIGWNAARPPNGTDPAFGEIVSLPVEFRIPFSVGWVPMFFKLEANFAMVMGLVGQATSAKGSLTFRVSGDDENAFAQGAPAPTNAAKTDGTAQLGSDTDIQTVAGSAIGVVFQLPKLSIGVGTKAAEAAYYISLVSRVDVKSSGVLAGVVPCRSVEWQVGLSHGIEWKVLGMGGKITEDLGQPIKGSVSVPEGRKCG